MKKIHQLLLLLITVCAFSLASCEKAENTITNDEQTVATTSVLGKWKLKSYIVSPYEGQDINKEFVLSSNVVTTTFEFKADNQFEIVIPNVGTVPGMGTYNGTYSLKGRRITFTGRFPYESREYDVQTNGNTLRLERVFYVKKINNEITVLTFNKL